GVRDGTRAGRSSWRAGGPGWVVGEPGRGRRGHQSGVPSGGAMGESEFEDLGPNSGLAEDMYGRYVEDPASVPDGWREFFDNREATRPAPQAPAPAPQSPSPAPPGAASTTWQASRSPSPAPEADGADRPVPMRGATARIVENMEASLGVPTATSVRTVPAKLLEVNRQILNNHLARTGGDKVSFTHLISFAVLKALARVPAMNSSFEIV